MQSIRFSFDTKYGVFNDALNLPDDAIYTDAELEAMKQARVDKWIYNIENPPIEESE